MTLPSHVLLPGAVYVVGNTSGTVFTPNLTSGGLTFNGNDAVELTDPSLARLDLIGVIGDDSVFAENITLVRKAGIVAGSDTYRADDWTQLATDTHQLGSHSP